MTPRTLNRRIRSACEEISFNALLDYDVREKVGISCCPIIRSAENMVEVFLDMELLKEGETLIAAAVDAELRLLRWNLVSIEQDLASAGFRTIDAFYSAIMSQARGVVLLQRRSQKFRIPSRWDATLTRKVADAGKMLGYPLLDHVIVHESGFWSLMPKRRNEVRQSRRLNTIAS